MHFHWCGNPFHDIPHNLVVLLSMVPDWLPYAQQVRNWATGHRQEVLHDHDH